MAKAVVRNLLAQACRFSGAIARQEKKARGRLTILCYHRILPEAEKQKYFCPDLVVTPEAFRVHCATVAEHYRVLPMTEAVGMLRAGGSSRPLLAMTFDDGYVDNLEYAAPLLEEHGIRGTFYPVAGLLGSALPPWYDVTARCVQQLHARGEGTDLQGRPTATIAEGAHATAVVEAAKDLSSEARHTMVEYLLERLGQAPDFHPRDGIMSAAQLRTLVDTGHEVGSHSVAHEILPLLTAEALAGEIQDSRELLRSALGKDIASFCYPNGDFDERTLSLVAESGYDHAVTTIDGDNAPGEPPFTLRRRFIHEGRLAKASGEASATLLRLEASGLRARLFDGAGGAA